MEDSMVVIQHDSLTEYDREYHRVRAAFVLRGTSLGAWLAERGINRQVAYQALKGQSHGKKAREVRALILREALAADACL